jgi:hypothetical protein
MAMHAIPARAAAVRVFWLAGSGTRREVKSRLWCETRAGRDDGWRVSDPPLSHAHELWKNRATVATGTGHVHGGDRDGG